MGSLLSPVRGSRFLVDVGTVFRGWRCWIGAAVGCEAASWDDALDGGFGGVVPVVGGCCSAVGGVGGAGVVPGRPGGALGVAWPGVGGWVG